MTIQKIKKIALTFLFMTTGAAGAAQAYTPFMETSGVATPPIGHVRYCQTNSSDCNVRSQSHDTVTLTIKLWRELNDVNFTANSLIRPVTDMEQYQEPERWTIPTLKGDCEDYVLLKRTMLHSAGWPLNTLLITVVRDEYGAGHAVLTVRTDRGDLILDNQSAYIVTWDQTPYEYIKRQSETHSAQWTRISDRRVPARMTVAQR